MLSYPIKTKRDSNGSYLVTFVDIPEAATACETAEQVQHEALDALESALGFYFEDGRAVPMPSAPKRGQGLVTLPASVSAKVFLINEMLAQKVRPADLARKLATTPQAVNRMTDLRHATKIDQLGLAFAALGRRLDFRVVAA